MTKTRKKKGSRIKPGAHPATAAATAPAADEPETTETVSTAAGAEAPAGDWQDRYLRLAAEFDNFRKRSARDFQSVVRNAEGALIGELTEVIDNLGRALDSDHKGESVDDFARGIGLIRDQLWQKLESRGLIRMETVGREFDPERHDALMRTPSGEHDEGVIVEEISPGYSLNGRILRHARVIVSQGKSDAPGDESECSE